MCGPEDVDQAGQVDDADHALSNGSRIGTPAQLQGLMPAQKCSAACTNTGSPVHKAVPMPLVPTTRSFQTPPTSRWIRRPSSSVWRSPIGLDDHAFLIGQDQHRLRALEQHGRPGRRNSRAASRSSRLSCRSCSTWPSRPEPSAPRPRVASMELRAQRCQDCWISGRTGRIGPGLVLALGDEALPRPHDRTLVIVDAAAGPADSRHFRLDLSQQTLPLVPGPTDPNWLRARDQTLCSPPWTWTDRLGELQAITNVGAQSLVTIVGQ